MELPLHIQNLSEPYQSIGDWLLGLCENNRLPGASLLVVKGEEPVIHVHVGESHDQRVLLLASASKWLSAATIMSLVEKGFLNLEDVIGDYFPHVPQPLASAGIRHLLSHTSGLPGTHAGLGPRHAWMDSEIERLLLTPVAVAPGRQFAYGGISMQVAGHIAECATGMAWESIFQKYMAAPIGMRSTHFGAPGKAGNPKIGSGARSTLEDYARFLSMILHLGEWNRQRILSTHSVCEMERDHVLGARKFSFLPQNLKGCRHGLYGLGVWRLEVDAQDQANRLASPGAFGFYPWIDRNEQTYGILALETRYQRPMKPFDFGIQLLNELDRLE